MDLKFEEVERIAALCGIMWFALIIDACYTWFFPWTVRYLISTPLIIYATLLIKKKNELVVTKQRWQLLLILILFLLFQLRSIGNIINLPLLYSPILCIVLWPKRILLLFYYYLKRFIVFYAIVSIVVEILVISGVWMKLPYLILPPQDNVQELTDTVNRFYGLFVIPEDTNELFFYRAMGPLREGGHFSIFLGFVYFVEEIVFEKRNKWIIVAGLLTLSPNFLFFFLVSEGYFAYMHKRILKNIGGILCFVFFVFLAVLYSPDFIKDEIIRIVIERSLENNIYNVDSEGYLALLDGRTNDIGLQMWNHFNNHASFFIKVIGMTASGLREGFVLSDFRYLIFRFGYFGFFLIIIITIKIVFFEYRGLYSFYVLLLALYVMLSRAWMFDQLYIWTMMLLAVNAIYVFEESDIDDQQCLTKDDCNG